MSQASIVSTFFGTSTPASYAGKVSEPLTRRSVLSSVVAAGSLAAGTVIVAAGGARASMPTGPASPALVDLWERFKAAMEKKAELDARCDATRIDPDTMNLLDKSIPEEVRRGRLFQAMDESGYSAAAEEQGSLCEDVIDPLANSIRAFPAMSLADVAIKARVGRAWDFPNLWDENLNSMDWDQQMVRVLVDQLADLADV